MRSFTSQSPAIELDGCRRCCAVWYDVGEFELMPEGAVSGTNEATMSAIEGLALARLAKLKTESGNKDDPDAEWKTIPAIFGLPVETDTVRFCPENCVSGFLFWFFLFNIPGVSRELK